MCPDTETIVGLFLFWIVAPTFFVGGIIFVACKLINIERRNCSAIYAFRS
ncbi:MAG TPA: hypothetical protein VF692_09265 [Pyrinomonadaceae bacterium]